ncbi:alpha-L-rhamnosidase [Catenovulum agarivorans DS-2]|uniref:alpha-L-rhamnosidase n=1 Tax=Catenovulum agarivorans DS-2 TaxID=1328313 RepID=W7QRH9_9ALTE|nr:alpha-L-rhamnosidase [Catenovulum agarivorans]EWH10488.1 alpha-L-rhamnosidase [Catenovulum agarivorans DS-2]
MDRLRVLSRTYKLYVMLVGFCWLLASCSFSFEQFSNNDAPVELKVGEGFVNPIGYYEAKPRFSWKIASSSVQNTQSAYQIQVGSAVEQGESFKANLWDSGKVASADNAWIRYAGQPLVSRQQLLWRVRIWDENKQASNWSELNRVELGLLSNQDWQAEWIAHPDTLQVNKPSQKTIATAQYFRKRFSAENSIQQARLYVTAKGLFKAFINGQMVAPDDAMTPGWTPYAKRIETLTYDVTDLLSQGENVLAANLAGGWYAGRVFKFTDKEHKVTPEFLAQLEIIDENGLRQVITTDNSWRVTQQGPIRFSSIYDGELYDQNKQMSSWAQVQFDDSAWQTAAANQLDFKVQLAPKRHAPIRNVASLEPVSIITNNNKAVIFDFGQNMVGVPKINVPALANQAITIRFAEALHKGEFYTENYRSAKSTDIFIPAADGIAEYQPRFTYHGYRYVEISGFDPNAAPSKSWVTAVVQHSDVEVEQNFVTSHAKLNKLAQNIRWGLKSNFYDIPLDCPQRDERLGWTGDAQVFTTPSMYMADVYAFWAAWLQSVREEQFEDGGVPLYIPFVEWINWPSSGWGDAATIIPWELYQMTGDTSILADNYTMMTRWLDYHKSQSDELISSMKTFGDWLQPYPDPAAKNPNRGDTRFDLISTAYFARSVYLTAQTASVLDKSADATRYLALFERIKHAFVHHFFDEKLNVKQGQSTQTTYLLGLAFDLFTGEQVAIAQHKLIELIEQADGHLRTGFLGTPLLAQVLQEAGRSDIVYDLIFKETYPSWFYSINNGATTTWERWNSYSIKDGFNPEGMNSLNHYAYGSIAQWFYQGILGIRAKVAGFKQVEIKPQVLGQLDSAEGFYDTPAGRIKVSWQLNLQQFTMNVSIPKNTSADVVIPAFRANTLMINQQSGKSADLSNLQPGEYQISAALTRQAP